MTKKICNKNNIHCIQMICVKYVLVKDFLHANDIIGYKLRQLETFFAVPTKFLQAFDIFTIPCDCIKTQLY